MRLLKHDPEKCEAVFRERSWANKKLKRDDDSTSSRLALEETVMHGIIESLSPEHGQIDWKWVGSVFVLYVVLMLGGARLLLAH
ncbi:hypothetical protein CWS35_10425 [Bradyrhizobium sp. SK17]|nr:hypothetical protein CWS35_10425 [Bradyrhizobium sp. SK17]